MAVPLACLASSQHPRAGKAGNPFQTTQGNRLSCRDEEGRRGSEEAVPGPSVSVQMVDGYETYCVPHGAGPWTPEVFLPSRVLRASKAG